MEDELAYENCCIAGRKTVGFGIYEHPAIFAPMSAERGEPCWGNAVSHGGPMRTFEQCCRPERVVSAGVPDLALALRKAWTKLSEARKLLKHRETRLLHLTQK